MNPSTTVTLYKTPFDASNRYVIAVDSVSEAYSIVQSYSHLEFTDCYWQRDDFSFRANGNIALLRQYNYCTYINKSRDTRFAFITDYEYVNDDMTLVHIKTDPWMTYAGRLVFNPSPMVRCHPKDNSLSECNKFNENLDNIYTKIDESFFNSEDMTMTDKDVVVLATNSLSRATGLNIAGDESIVLSADTILRNISALNAWTSYLSCGALPGTSIVWTGGPTTINDIKDYIDNFKDFMRRWYVGSTSVVTIGNDQISTVGIYGIEDVYLREIAGLLNSMGRLSDLVDVYKIPLALRPSELSSGQNLKASQLTARVLNKDFTMYIPTNIHWRKTKISPQFYKVFVNCCGDVKELPFDLINYNGESDTITGEFEILSNPLPNGGIIVNTKINAVPYGAEFMVRSPSWDKVTVNGYSLNQAALTQMAGGMQSAGNAAIYGGIGTVANGVASFDGGLTIKGAIGSIFNPIKDRETLAKSLSYNMTEGLNNQMRQSYTLGSSGSLISTYINSGGMLRLSYYRLTPVSVENTETVFSTYGYLQGGLVKDIVFKQLPKWHYYQTVEACIEGDDVPQTDLKDVIDMFNSGVFVFTSKDTYKKFEDVSSNHY